MIFLSFENQKKSTNIDDKSMKIDDIGDDTGDDTGDDPRPGIIYFPPWGSIGAPPARPPHPGPPPEGGHGDIYTYIHIHIHIYIYIYVYIRRRLWRRPLDLTDPYGFFLVSY